jgi:hypothetical protein
MEDYGRFSIVFEKLREEQEKLHGENKVTIDYQSQSDDELRRLSEAIAEISQVNYRLITTT